MKNNDISSRVEAAAIPRNLGGWCNGHSKNKAERFNEELNLYLNAIAHEFRSPLVSVQGYAALLVEEYGDLLPAEGKQYLDRIFANLRQADDILIDLSRFARTLVPESEFEYVAANEIVEAALEPLVRQLKQDRIELIVQPGLPRIFCHVRAMIQVFTNLLSNATKYLKENAPGQIEIGYLGDEIFHKFYVKDNGVGMLPKERNKVFLLFSRLGNKKRVSGSGLGLAIVKRIIEGHGGEVWVDARRHKGATFYFTLPKKPSSF
ncbi:MAG: ATP-binding protein [bacterium]